MRRHDREVTDFDDIISIMRKCTVCTVAVNDKEVPYIVPMNFGMTVNDKLVKLYFHGALEGTKYDLIKKDNRVSFMMMTEEELRTNYETGRCTMMYESVIGKGIMTIVQDEEKEEALDILCRQFHKEGFDFNRAAVPRTKVMCLEVQEMTAKRKK